MIREKTFVSIFFTNEHFGEIHGIMVQTDKRKEKRYSPWEMKIGNILS